MIRAARILWCAIRARYLQSVLNRIPMWHPEYIVVWHEAREAEARLLSAWEE